MHTPELQAKLEDYRHRASAGTLTREELRDALAMLRAERMGVGRTAPAKAKKPAGVKKAPVNSDDLLSELEGL